MTLVRWNPTRDLMNLQNEMNRIFAESAPSREQKCADWCPLADVVESEDIYTIHMDMPGLDKNDIKMDFADNTLAVTGERKQAERSENETSHRVERIYGTFFRKFRFPHPVETGKIKAKFTDGVLTITVPKAEEAKPRRIEIQ